MALGASPNFVRLFFLSAATWSSSISISVAGGNGRVRRHRDIAMPELHMDQIDADVAQQNADANAFIEYASSSWSEQRSRSFVERLLTTYNSDGPTAQDMKDAKKYFYDTHPTFKPDEGVDVAALQGLDERILTRTAIEALPEPTKILRGDTDNGGQQLIGLTDVQLDDNVGWQPLVDWFDKNPEGTPLVAMGYWDVTFDPHLAGSMHGVKRTEFHPADRMTMLGRKWQEAKPRMNGRTFTLYAGTDENWGLFSTWYPNRTITWQKPSDRFYTTVERFLDCPEVNLVFHRQHFNFTHPKIVPVPLSTKDGGYDNDPVFLELRKPEAKTELKTAWLGMYSSEWGGRFRILNDFKVRYGDDLSTVEKVKETMRLRHPHDKAPARVDQAAYLAGLRGNRFQLCVAGLGFDTYRLWESQRVGTIPIVERGFGFDRLMTRLPVLIVDDFDNLSMSFLQAIYPYYLKHAKDYLWQVHEFEFWRRAMKSQTLEDALKEFPFPSLPPYYRPYETPCPSRMHLVQVNCPRADTLGSCTTCKLSRQAELEDEIAARISRHRS
mmetsp:Transcript_30830/g.88028  ORF Transcript_30830/g.88028 Transcript_30830/m.88028 type:complete len:552 (+) Transcript_30830:72-1727(+)